MGSKTGRGVSPGQSRAMTGAATGKGSISGMDQRVAKNVERLASRAAEKFKPEFQNLNPEMVDSIQQNNPDRYTSNLEDSLRPSLGDRVTNTLQGALKNFRPVPFAPINFNNIQDLINYFRNTNNEDNSLDSIPLNPMKSIPLNPMDSIPLNPNYSEPQYYEPGVVPEIAPGYMEPTPFDLANPGFDSGLRDLIQSVPTDPNDLYLTEPRDLNPGLPVLRQGEPRPFLRRLPILRQGEPRPFPRSLPEGILSLLNRR